MPDTAPDAARQRVLPIFGIGDLIVMTFLAKQSANVHSWRKTAGKPSELGPKKALAETSEVLTGY
jgi:hypothetical protein